MWHKVILDKNKPTALYYVELRLPQLLAASTAAAGSPGYSQPQSEGSEGEGCEGGFPCARTAVMAELHLRLVGESLRSLSYEASGAGLNCWQSPLQMRGLSLQCEGFSDTLPQVIPLYLPCISPVSRTRCPR